MYHRTLKSSNVFICYFTLMTAYSELQSILSLDMLAAESPTTIKDDSALGKNTHIEMATSRILEEKHNLAQPLNSSLVYTQGSISSEEKPDAKVEEATPKPLADHEYVTGHKLAAIVAPDDLPGVPAAYSNSVSCVFYLVATLAAVSILLVWGFGWMDLRKTDNIAVAVADGAVLMSNK